MILACKMAAASHTEVTMLL